MKFKAIQPITLLLSLTVMAASCRKKTETEEIKPSEVVVPVNEEKPAQAKLEKSDSLYIVTSALIKIGAQFDPNLAPFKTLSKYDVTLYRIQYQTEYKGKNISASGILAVPVSPSSFSTLSFQHGTVFADSDAPTNNRNDQTLIASLASAGYIIAAPDYIGFGSSTGITHPYYVAQYSASTSRDMLTATKEFLSKKQIKTTGKLFLAGYSQGGNVTMAVSKSIESSPLAGYELIASAAGAGGYNMEGIFTSITSRKSYPSPNYIAYIIQSYRKTYDWNTPLSYYFKDPYADKIPGLIDGKTASDVINNNLTTEFDSLIQPGFVNAVKNGTDLNFTSALRENSIHNWKPTKPLRIYHSDADEVVPYSDAEETYNKMLALGSSSVSFVPIQGKSHGQATVPMIALVIEWFNSINTEQ